MPWRRKASSNIDGRSGLPECSGCGKIGRGEKLDCERGCANAWVLLFDATAAGRVSRDLESLTQLIAAFALYQIFRIKGSVSQHQT